VIETANLSIITIFLVVPFALSLTMSNLLLPRLRLFLQIDPPFGILVRHNGATAAHIANQVEEAKMQRMLRYRVVIYFCLQAQSMRADDVARNATARERHVEAADVRDEA